MANAEDAAAYRREMSDSRRRAVWRSKAQALTAARASGRRRRPTDRRVRQKREQCQRAQRHWDRAQALGEIEAEDARPFAREARRRQGALRAAGADTLKDSSGDVAALGAWAAAQRRHGVAQPPLAELTAEFLPHPSQFASHCLAWRPRVRDHVDAALPKAMKKESLAHLARWERLHTVLDEPMAMPVAPETKGAKRRRLCWESGRCTCNPSPSPSHGLAPARAAAGEAPPGARESTRQRFERILHQQLMAALSSASKVFADSTPARVAADSGILVLQLVVPAASPELAGTDVLWCHVGYLRYQPLRMAVLRVSAAETPP